MTTPITMAIIGFMVMLVSFPIEDPKKGKHKIYKGTEDEER